MKASHGSLCETTIGQRGAVNGACSRLVGEQECGAELPSGRASPKHTVEIGRGCEAARGEGGYIAMLIAAVMQAPIATTRNTRRTGPGKLG